MATVYRNLQEQVYENAKDIEDLQNTSKDKFDTLETKTQLITSDNVKTAVGGNFEVTGTLMLHEGLWKASTNTYAYLPDKTGTLALVEDIPANTGNIKAHTIENDADKNYKTIINLGSGNSGSTLHLEAPGDNGIGSIDIANEYSQGSTSIKFTADKLVFGNTEITEQQLQQLLQLIQNQ